MQNQIKTALSLLMVLALLAACQPVKNEVKITDNWVRATQQGQEVGAAYMTLTSNTDTSLTSIETPVAGSVEIHSMSMDNGVMKMRMLEQLDLKANTPNQLAPGGFHLMLFDLKKALKVGDSVHFSLHFKDAQHKETIIELDSPIKAD